MASEGYGFLYPVKDEDKKQNGPTASGTAILNGQEVKVAAWTKTSKGDGTRYLSLKFEGHELEVGDVPPPDEDMPF